MKTTLVGFLLLFMSSSFAASVFDKVTPGQPICYGREYSADYLKSRPKQTVQKILAKFSKDAEYNQNIMTVEITLKGKKHFYKNYRSTLFCGKNDNCYVECDGGSATVSLQDDGRLYFKNNGFAIQGGCSSESEEDGFLLKPTPNGDDRFRLIKIPSGFCQKVPTTD